MSKKHRFNLPSKGYNGRFESIKNISGLVAAFDYRFGVYTDTAMTTRAAVGQTVKGWQDRSGNGYHATEATNPPTLAADGLQFDGTNDVLRVARMTGQFGNGFSWFMVLRLPDGRTGNIFLFGAFDNVDVYFSLRNSSIGALANRTQENGVAVDANITTLPDGNTGVFIASATATPSATATGYYNGVSGTPASIAGLNWANLAGATTETQYIGALNINGTPSNFSAFILARFLIYNRPLAASELTQVHRYLGRQSGISVP